MAQNWILNKETGRFELFEEYEAERTKTKQKALLEYNLARINKEDEH